MEFTRNTMCWGYQKLEGQTGEWKLHQVLLIPRCSLVLRKSVSCRLLGTGRTHQGTSLILPCACALHEPPGSSLLGQGALWCGLVQPPLLGLPGVVWCHSGWEISVGILRGKWIVCKEGYISASEYSSVVKVIWMGKWSLLMCNLAACSLRSGYIPGS